MKDFARKHLFLIVAMASVLAFAGMVLLVDYLTPEIKLNGQALLKLPVYEKYEEKGASAFFGNTDISGRIETTGKVDETRTGSYHIYYGAVNFIFRTIAERIIDVVDNTPPEIVLTGTRYMKICPHEAFVEPGFSARDNYDGDLTKKVEVTVNENLVIYYVRDISGNMTSSTRILDRNDKEAPLLKLKGSPKMSIVLGGRYVEPGYTVTDAYDREIKDKVKITGSVNTKVAGTYKVTYAVTDCSGNSSKVIRTVVVVKPAPKAPAVVDSGTNAGGKSTIYLTFDDGSSYLTPQILDILKSEGVKATFFVLGSRRNDTVWKRMVKEGHTIALHSNTHNYATIYSSVAAYYKDLYAVRDKVKAATGVDSKILRFPGGSSNTVSRNYSPGIMSYLVKDVQKKGFHYFDWNISSGDTANYTASRIASNVTSKLGSRAVYVVLMHDYGGNETTRDALKTIIRYGKAHGYKFSNITMSTPQIHHGVSN